MEKKILIITVLLTISTVLAIPIINLFPQDVGEGSPVIYAVIYQVYNNHNTNLYNYTIRIVINNTDVPKYYEISKNLFVTDLYGNPLYFWIEQSTKNYTLLWVKIPEINASSYYYVVIWYGYYNNPFQEYNNPYKTFIKFYNMSNTNYLSNWENYYVGVNYNDYNYTTSDLEIEPEGLYMKKRMQPDSEVFDASKSTFTTNQEYYFEFMVNPIGGNGRSISVGIANNYYGIYGFGSYSLLEFDVKTTGSNMYLLDSYYDYNDIGYKVGPVNTNNWYLVDIYVNNQYVIGDVYIDNGSVFSPLYTGWIVGDGYQYVYTNYRIVIGQRVPSDRRGQKTVEGMVKYIAVRYGVYPDLTVTKVGIYSYLVFS